MIIFIKIIAILFLVLVLSYLFKFYIAKNNYESLTENVLPSYDTLTQEHEVPPKYQENT